MFDNDDPAQRKALIQALQACGLGATEYSSGGGIMHVIVPLLDGYGDPPITASDPDLRKELEAGLQAWKHEALLCIATGSAYKPCEVGLFGYNGQTGRQVDLQEWKEARSLEEAKALFQRFWDMRDKWLKAFLAGELDVA